MGFLQVLAAPMFEAWAEFTNFREPLRSLLDNVEQWRAIDVSGTYRWLVQSTSIVSAICHRAMATIDLLALAWAVRTGEQVTKDDIKLALPPPRKARSSRPSMTCDEALESAGVGYVS